MSKSQANYVIYLQCLSWALGLASSPNLSEKRECPFSLFSNVSVLQCLSTFERVCEWVVGPWYERGYRVPLKEVYWGGVGAYSQGGDSSMECPDVCVEGLKMHT